MDGELGLRETRLEVLVRDEGDHGVGDVPDAPEPAGLGRQPFGGDVHAHAADHDRHELEATQKQAIVIDDRHGDSLRRAWMRA
jgi:hypothetical protein